MKNGIFRNLPLLLLIIAVSTVSSCSKSDSTSSSGDDTDDGASTKCVAVDLGLSVKWASCNVGATSPESYGGYYAWGETEEKSVYTDSTFLYYDSRADSCINIGTNICGTKYDVAHVKMGGTWRMPTHAEIEELCSKCKTIWTTYKGVYGRKFIGSNGNSIFLPLSGYRTKNVLEKLGSEGYYWSGNAYNVKFNDDAWDFEFNASAAYPESNKFRFYGYSVRPVSD